MFLPIPMPKSVLETLKDSVANAPEPKFPEKLNFMPIAGTKKLLAFVDARIAILLSLPALAADGTIVEEGRADLLFYGKTFSNFSRTSMHILLGDDYGKVYVCNCAEVLLHACKALHFGDHEAFQKIAESKTPKDAKAAGRAVRNFDDAKWFEATPAVMNEIARLKLLDMDFRDMLILLALCSLKHRIPFEKWSFYEATETDSKFATGMAMDEHFLKLQTLPADHAEKIFPGKNMLGLAIQGAFRLFTGLVLDLGCNCDLHDTLKRNDKECLEAIGKKFEAAAKDFGPMQLKYEQLNGKDFCETSLFQVVEGGVKKAKIESVEKTDEPIDRPILVEYVVDAPPAEPTAETEAGSDAMLVESLVDPPFERCGSGDPRSVSCAL